MTNYRIVLKTVALFKIITLGVCLISLNAFAGNFETRFENVSQHQDGHADHDLVDIMQGIGCELSGAEDHTATRYIGDSEKSMKLAGYIGTTAAFTCKDGIKFIINQPFQIKLYNGNHLRTQMGFLTDSSKYIKTTVSENVFRLEPQHEQSLKGAFYSIETKNASFILSAEDDIVAQAMALKIQSHHNKQN